MDESISLIDKILSRIPISLTLSLITFYFIGHYLVETYKAQLEYGNSDSSITFWSLIALCGITVLVVIGYGATTLISHIITKIKSNVSNQ